MGIFSDEVLDACGDFPHFRRINEGHSLADLQLDVNLRAGFSGSQDKMFC